MKKLLCLAFALILCAIFHSALAETNGTFTYSILTNGMLQLNSYNGTALEITIPNSIDGRDVYYINFSLNSADPAQSILRFFADPDSVAARAISRSGKKFSVTGNPNVVFQYHFEEDATTDLAVYAYDTDITSATIPSFATTIGVNGFADCKSLSNVTIPENITSIGGGAFAFCESFTEISVPGSVKTVGDTAFYGCSNLRKITFENGTENFGFEVFWAGGTQKLEEVTLPGTMKRFDASMHFLEGAPQLKRVVILEGMEEIGDNALNSCYNLTSVTIPESVKIIGECAFGYCTSLPEIILPSSIEQIKNSAFRNCDALERAIIPEDAAGLKEISEGVFSSCGKLTTVTIPGGITKICESAFSGCSNLPEIKLPASLETIGKSAFSKCESLKDASIPEGVTSIGESAFEYCAFTEINIPASVKTLGYRAFAECGELQVLTFANGVESIGEDAFRNCTNLVSVTIPGTIKSIDRYSVIPSGLTHLTNVVILPGLEEIGNLTFDGDSALTSIVIPEGVTLIGECAFSGCSALPEIDLPSTVETIGKQAFSYCASLKTMIIPNGVKSVGDRAFQQCGALEKVSIAGSVQSLSNSMFIDCTSLKDVTIQKGIASIDDAAFYRCGALEQISIPGSVKTIGGSAFAGCDGLTDIFIADGVTSIATDAFTWGKQALHVGCQSYALTWAKEKGYPSDDEAEEGHCRYVLVHANIVVDEAVEATCLETGLSEGSHCTDCQAILVPQNVVEALGHDWNTPDYEWSADNKTVKATAICKRNAEHVVTETVNTTSVQSKEPTYTEKGETTYTAQFTNPVFTKQTKKLDDIPVLPEPVVTPTSKTTATPTAAPTATPTPAPTATPAPTTPTPAPTATPTPAPTATPTPTPTATPTPAPTATPTPEPTATPTPEPTATPTPEPTATPEPENYFHIKKDATVKVQVKDTIQIIVDGYKVKKYETDDKKVATVSKKGLVKAVGDGTAKITITTTKKVKGDYKTLVLTVKVTDPDAPKSVKIKEGKKKTLNIGDKLQLTAVLKPEKANTKLTWTTSDKKIATVSKKGLVKAKKEGKVEITVTTSNGKSATIKITVKKKK